MIAMEDHNGQSVATNVAMEAMGPGNEGRKVGKSRWRVARKPGNEGCEGLQWL